MAFRANEVFEVAAIIEDYLTDAHLDYDHTIEVTVPTYIRQNSMLTRFSEYTFFAHGVQWEQRDHFEIGDPEDGEVTYYFCFSTEEYDDEDDDPEEYDPVYWDE